MKKIIIIIFILAGIKNVSAGVFLGPQFGFNIATLNSTEITVNTKLGWHAGFYVNIPLIEHVSVMPAILYSTKGFKYSYTTETTNTLGDSVVHESSNINATLGYIDIPVLLTVFSGKSSGFMLQVGPQFSYLIGNTTNISTSSTVSVNGSASQPTNPATTTSLGFHKSDIGLTGGIGFKIPLIFVYARATTGFMKVQQTGFVKDADAGHNFVIEIGAALSFGAI